MITYPRHLKGKEGKMAFWRRRSFPGVGTMFWCLSFEPPLDSMSGCGAVRLCLLALLPLGFVDFGVREQVIYLTSGGCWRAFAAGAVSVLIPLHIIVEDAVLRCFSDLCQRCIQSWRPPIVTRKLQRQP
jgi:hypothetical protein